MSLEIASINSLILAIDDSLPFPLKRKFTVFHGASPPAAGRDARFRFDQFVPKGGVITMAKIIGDNKGNRLDGTGKADSISGRGGDDRIAGHRGNDILNGNAGNDKIGGGQGHDVLTGGAGKDTFVFNSFAAKDSDKITDFKSKVDKLQFDHDMFDIAVGKLATGAFFAGTKAHDADDRFIYDKKTGKLYYDDDGNGAHAQQLIATLTNHAKLAASDFIIS